MHVYLSLPLFFSSSLVRVNSESVPNSGPFEVTRAVILVKLVLGSFPSEAVIPEASQSLVGHVQRRRNGNHEEEM